MTTVEARQVEHEKYTRAYALETYRMGERRHQDAVSALADLPNRGPYLDVGCGRGEMLKWARQLGFASVLGVEVVPALIDGVSVIYGEAYSLPFSEKSFDVVTLFDVLEHLLPGDDEAVCRELARVARRHVLLTANNHESKLPDGTALHINRRPYPEWDRLVREWFSPAAAAVVACPNISYENSPMWRVDL